MPQLPILERCRSFQLIHNWNLAARQRTEAQEAVIDLVFNQSPLDYIPRRLLRPMWNETLTWVDPATRDGTEALVHRLEYNLWLTFAIVEDFRVRYYIARARRSRIHADVVKLDDIVPTLITLIQSLPEDERQFWSYDVLERLAPERFPSSLLIEAINNEMRPGTHP